MWHPQLGCHKNSLVPSSLFHSQLFPKTRDSTGLKMICCCFSQAAHHPEIYCLTAVGQQCDSLAIYCIHACGWSIICGILDALIRESGGIPLNTHLHLVPTVNPIHLRECQLTEKCTLRMSNWKSFLFDYGYLRVLFGISQDWSTYDLIDERLIFSQYTQKNQTMRAH